MGKDFRRDRDSGAVNGLLNYGYTVMRALCARSIVAAGLHPSIGVHHANRLNAFALADDLIEPYRALVDALAVRLVANGIGDVTPVAKRAFARLTAFDLSVAGGTTPLSLVVARTAQSLARAFETGRSGDLVIPDPPPALDIAALDGIVVDLLQS